MNKQHSICIIDDHQLILEGVERMLAGQHNWQFAGGFTSVPAFEQFISTDRLPDLLLLDIHLPGEDGLAVCKQLHKKYPALKIVMLTSLSEPAIVKTALKNGASGFLLKNMQKEELLDCFSRVLAGETYLHKEMEKLLLQNSLGIKQETNYIPKLSRREQEVLDLIAKEHTSQEIADLLFVSVNTVETHRASLLSKFGARNIAGLVKAAVEKGLIN